MPQSPDAVDPTPGAPDDARARAGAARPEDGLAPPGTNGAPHPAPLPGPPAGWSTPYVAPVPLEPEQESPPDEPRTGDGWADPSAGTPSGTAAGTAAGEAAGDAAGTQTAVDAPPWGAGPVVATAAPERRIPDADELRERLLGAATLALDATRRNRVVGWVVALAVTALGAVLRFWNLGSPHELVFDETYYVKDGWSLVERGYEADWGEEPNPRFEQGDASMLGTKAEYFVHPQVGKWLIGLGMRLGGGVESAFSWRLAVAVLGTLSVLMLTRIARRLFASTAWGAVAGGLLAIDGMGIVMSRTSLLDPVLMFFVLAAFGALVLDREQSRRRLAVRQAALLAEGKETEFGPGLGWRWWRFAAAVLLGLAIGTKWSGLYFLAVFGVLTVLWDATARRTAGVRVWAAVAFVRDAVPAAFVMVGTAVVVYVGTWWSWFTNAGSYGRQWAAEHPGEGLTFLPEGLRSLFEFHRQMWNFHRDLDSPHTYQAHPLGWIVQWRPTSFFWGDESGLSGADAQAACGTDHCARAILAIGNPVVWWAGAAAILVALFWLVWYRDWRAGAVLSGLVAGWAPWFLYSERTIFAFYSIAFTPWVVLTLVYVLTLVVGPPTLPPRARRGAIIGVGVFLAVVVLVSAFFYPIWAGWTVPYDFWHQHMWLRQWV
ncbi:dolichyl-phosphate-mannose--protein mannosyltransferase [Cellulomonas sp. PSBB021]|uniref:dolichyl-phosphate-mannose--protein mannosyltransferase n=1 Tax=Cellulomonas sp. PSBB021 TaxID=2003551 RepID=UPI001E595F9C|nr:phospholipid carrier-dependent glycosyltransferase [Cellulomonas sp. PSBB021]